MTRHYPPYFYLVQVLEHCPQAGALYLKIWKEKNRETYRVSYSKKHIVNDAAISWKKFKNDLRCLFREGVCEFFVSDDDSQVDITLAEEPADLTPNIFTA